ncbi:MAG: anhydro-N-acetylmuramic acid kinase, partial [Pseudomonadota bacterium]
TLQARLRKVCEHFHNTANEELSSISSELASFYSMVANEALVEAQVQSADVAAIANHGQTVDHAPPLSTQLGDPQAIADQTGIRTIMQFRQADLAAGGQGAPLMPAFHASHMRPSRGSRVVLNIGGIANITLIPSANTSVLGFDTGPGNVLMDEWMRAHFDSPYDRDGELASKGESDPTLLSRLLNDPYFSKPYPKSTGTDYFNLNWVREKFPDIDSLSRTNVLATFLELTVETIANSIEVMVEDDQINELVICGGGANNGAILRNLADRLPSASIKTSDQVGLPADYLEAIGFAWLGYCFDQDHYSNLPSVTGAKRSVVLGQEFHPQ